MRTSLTNFSTRPLKRQGGVAVIVMLALLALILIYITANARSLRVLDRELDLTEQRQVQRLKALHATKPPTPASTTNAAPAILSNPTSEL